jgi:enoyl-CoA hydratase/carnithine racemase
LPRVHSPGTPPAPAWIVGGLDVAVGDQALVHVVHRAAGRLFESRPNGPAPAAPSHAAGTGEEAHRDGGGRVALRIFGCLKSVIAAVNGAAVGIGATMLLPMDIRLASEDARFGFVFTRRGIVPEACSSWFLPRVVGISRALEWTYSGRVFGAAEALAGGLVSRVLPPEQLLPAARELAREIADHAAPVSVALTRQMMWHMLGASHPMDAHRVDSRAIVDRGTSADANEGVSAFLAKRSAVFADRVSKDMPPFFPWWQEPRFE